jgi:DNA-binding response OmpR family regulator/signal transduction histidine kinase
MSNDRILVVEDDPQTAEYIRSYFHWQGYEVMTANRGDHALASCRLKLPSAIIMDIMLPDANGFELCRTLRNNSRTSHVPIIFLSHRNKRNDIIFAFEVGADDYLVKPFDIEELKLRVEGTIRHSRRGVLRHPITNLPAGELIVEQLKAIKDSPEPWTLLYFSLRNFDLFRVVADSQVANNRLIELADILRAAVETYGGPQDFIGHASDDGFVVVTMPEAAHDICKTVIDQFKAESLTVAQASGLLKLHVNAVSSYDGPFTDIREITEALAQLWVNEQKLDWLNEMYCQQSHAADLDFCNQLSEHAALWRTSPGLAQALIEVERLVTTKLPDMHKIKILLDTDKETKVHPEVLGRLQDQQKMCYLAAQNLDELRYKTRGYQKSAPAPLAQTLAQVVKLLQKSHPNISAAAADISDLTVILPEEKLQQVFYNICHWLLDDEPKQKLVISVEPGEDMVSVMFGLADLKQAPPDPLTLLPALDRNAAGAVYGYLALKIVSRYGGRLELAREWLVVRLPLNEPSEHLSTAESGQLRQQIREYRLFLDGQKEPPLSAATFDKAANLIDPLAEDLLTEIEAMLVILNTHSGIDIHAYPWSAIQRYCLLSRMLALDLRKYRPLIPAPVNLKSLLESLRPLLTHRVLNHEILIETEVAGPVLNTDKTRLSQILVNLALNALEAMPEEGVLKFHISSVDDYFVVDVVDTGRGISPESLPYIFDPHFTTKGAGRGLGLHNVKTYIEQLHGQIEVSSQIGKGTTVTVKLPPSWGAGYF